MSSSTGGDKGSSEGSGSGGGGGGSEAETVTKKSGDGGGSTSESSAKPSEVEVNGKPADTVKDDDTQAPTDDQPKEDKNSSSVITTEAPPLGDKTPVDPKSGFVPISRQEKVPITSIGVGVAPVPFSATKDREAMMPAVQTFISSAGGVVGVSSVVTTTTAGYVDDEDERDRQLTERLAEQGDHGMAHNPDSASTLLPEVAQLFSAHSSLQQRGGVPLPGQIPPGGGYANYPGSGYNNNMEGQMQSQHGYYYMGGMQGRLNMG